MQPKTTTEGTVRNPVLLYPPHSTHQLEALNNSTSFPQTIQLQLAEQSVKHKEFTAARTEPLPYLRVPVQRSYTQVTHMAHTHNVDTRQNQWHSTTVDT